MGRGRILSTDVSPDKDTLAVVTSEGLWMYDLNTLEPHENSPVMSMTGSVIWSPDGEQLMLWSNHYDGWTARIVDRGNGQEVHLLEGDTLDANRVDWSPDGSRIAFSSRDGLVHVWDIGEERELVVLEAQVESISPVVWSPDGSLLATGGMGLVAVWDSVNWQQQYAYEFGLPAYDWIGDLAWSPNGELLAGVAGSSSDKWIWNVAEKTARQLPHIGLADSLTWSPDSSQLAFSGYDGIQIFDVASGNRTTVSETLIPATEELAWLREESRLLAVGANRIELWDVDSGRLIQRVDKHIDAWRADVDLEWSPDSGLLALPDVGSMKIWDADESRLLHVLKGAVLWNLFVWAPDATQLAAWSAVEANSNTQDGNSRYGVCGVLRVWDVNTGRVLYEAIDEENSNVQSLEWTSAGIRLASLGNREVRIWEPVDGRQFGSIETDIDTITQLSLSSDGNLLALEMSDGTIQIRSVEDSTIIQTLDGVIAPSSEWTWSPDAELLAIIGTGGFLQVWEIASGELTLQCQEQNSYFTAITWSPDSSKVAAGLFSGQIFIWESRTGRLLHVLDVQNALNSVSWSPDGNRLATLEADGHIQVWCFDSCD